MCAPPARLLHQFLKGLHPIRSTRRHGRGDPIRAYRPQHQDGPATLSYIRIDFGRHRGFGGNVLLCSGTLAKDSRMFRTYIRAEIRRWIDNEPQPGIVECRFTDVVGHEWVIIEKSSLVAEASLNAESGYPQPASIACEVVSRNKDSLGREIAEISTDKPWSIKATDGTTVFHVLAGQLFQKNSI